MSTEFASVGDTEEKSISFIEMGRGCYAFTAEGDPNTGVVIGDDSVLVIDAQATPAMAEKVVEKIRKVTSKPIRHLALTHYHAVRTLGASGLDAENVIASDLTRRMIAERGEADWKSELGRFPRLFQAAETIPGLTWPSFTFSSAMSVWLGNREVRLSTLGRGHTMGDVVCYVPDAGVMFAGDLVEHRSACYCGDAHLADWPRTLDRIRAFRPKALMPGRGGALMSAQAADDAIDMTRDFIVTLFETTKRAVNEGASLTECYEAVRTAMDPKFSDFAIYEHCMPFNVSRAYDEASGIDHPAIWTEERDREMWEMLQGLADAPNAPEAGAATGHVLLEEEDAAQ
ncbi:MBL fold metallo-hydrolase [Rhizobiales bacterium]|uniref:MBL fold metallo-hydrolase n=1 Tax=Hongsoonwoonella zoysiae TaxID=2821844 RepID=UPI0015611130|nr:MBL fold metallo-hydrolase [Hongsoonwoonella zoysiae]NRG18618.1 MBL fold metallo-hydrolase [Hongsoonwoonella zoysiae]